MEFPFRTTLHCDTLPVYIHAVLLLRGRDGDIKSNSFFIKAGNEICMKNFNNKRFYNFKQTPVYLIYLTNRDDPNLEDVKVNISYDFVKMKETGLRTVSFVRFNTN